MRWLRERLSTDGNCHIAFLHRPRFSASKHGDQAQLDPYWRELRGRSRLLLGGHEHNMEELKPRDGVRQLISGAAGRHLYDVRESDSRLAWSNDTRFGALRLRLAPGRADYAFVAADGTVLRRGSVSCAA